MSSSADGAVAPRRGEWTTVLPRSASKPSVQLADATSGMAAASTRRILGGESAGAVSSEAADHTPSGSSSVPSSDLGANDVIFSYDSLWNDESISAWDNEQVSAALGALALAGQSVVRAATQELFSAPGGATPPVAAPMSARSAPLDRVGSASLCPRRSCGSRTWKPQAVR